MKRITAGLLSIIMIFSLFPIVAVGESNDVYSIENAADLVELAKKCTMDSYSKGLTVELKNDIDLSESDFTSIPYFSGRFNGNGHTIKNFSITIDGSNQGFFRCVSNGAFVSNLNVNGKVTPGGSKCTLGGIAGTNGGTITNCNFSGKISGVESIGGIVGINSGTVSECAFYGEITGEHRIGGIVGENSGIISNCTNNGEVNTVAVTSTSSSSNTLLNNDISQLSEDDFLDITDIGGVSGYSEGIIEGCRNNGKVGYDRTGYNVGGIVGRECGYVNGCENNSDVLGRKDVGGIVGQLEPSASWEFSENKLTDFKNELEKLNKQIEKLSNDADSSSDNPDGGLSQSLNDVQNYIRQTVDDTHALVGQTSENLDKIGTASDEIMDLITDSIDKHQHERTHELILQLKEMLNGGNAIIQIPDMLSVLSMLIEEEKTHFEDEHFNSDFDLVAEMEEIISENTVTQPDSSTLFNDFQNVMNSVNDVKDSVDNVKGNLKDKADVLKQDISEIEEQVDTVFDTFFGTVKNMADIDVNNEQDVSLEYSDSRTEGAISDCKNYAEVNAETNAGGVVGAIAFEISFDAEDKLNISDYFLKDAKYMIFALVSNSESYSDITAKKSCAGGIVGNMEFGAVLDSVSAGTVNVTSGDYCGGVSGLSKGNIKGCYSRSLLSGDKYIGGIVGDGENVSDCKSYSFINGGKEYYGTIAGNINGAVENSLFVENEVGAVDGISYENKAEPITYEEMIKLDGIPDVFKKTIVSFVVENETVEEVEVEFGGSIEKLPEVPMKGVQYWKWDDFDKEHVYYSMTVKGQYCNPKTTISTGEDVPLFLVEGNFYEGQKLTVKEFTPETYDTAIAAEDVVFAYTLSVNNYTGKFKVRMKAADKGELYIIGDDSKYKKTDYETDGSYLVFDAENGDSIIFVKNDSNYNLVILVAVAAVIIVVLVILLILVKKRNTQIKSDDRNKTDEEDEGDDDAVDKKKKREVDDDNQ